MCSAPTGVAQSSGYASTRLANAVLMAALRLHNDASFARYVGVVSWGVSGNPAQRVGRRNAQHACCDAQSERHHCHGGINCEL